MSYGNFRSSTGNLGFGDDGRSPGPERWDRDKFERFARRNLGDKDVSRFEERARHHDSPNRRDVEIEDRFDRRGPRGEVRERDRFFEEDRFAVPRRRPDFLDDDRPTDNSRALAPYRRKSIVDRDLEPPSRRAPRPQFIRRQSSLDTFDRRPMPRFGDRDRDDWRPPINTPIPLPRRRSPSRRRYREEDIEETRYRESSPSDAESDYRDVRVRRERSTRRRSVSRYRAKSAKSSTSSFEEVSPAREEKPKKRGKTRMPKRLVNKRAVIELGYPFEEEEDFIIVRQALGKEQIDEVIKLSESYKESKYDESGPPQLEAPPPPPPPAIPIPPPGGEFVQTTTMEYIAPPPQPPPPPQYYQPHPPPPPPASYHPPPQSIRSVSPPRHREREVFEERVEESNHIGGPLTIVLPDRTRRSERDIKSEIRALEAEKKALQLEREADERRYQADLIRESDYEFVERRSKEKDIVRVEKDRKGRLALVRSSH